MYHINDDKKNGAKDWTVVLTLARYYVYEIPTVGRLLLRYPTTLI